MPIKSPLIMLSYIALLLLLQRVKDVQDFGYKINVVLLIVQLALLAVAGPLPPYHLLRAILTITTSDNNTTSYNYYSEKTWNCKNIKYATIWDGEVCDSNAATIIKFPAQETGGPNGVMYTATMPYIAEVGYETAFNYPRKDRKSYQ